MWTLWTDCYAKYRDSLRAFGRAQNGNIAVTFALLLIPIIATAGAAVDYSRVNSVRADLQAALDSTALMLAKEAADDTNSQLQTNALAYFKAAFNRPEAQNITIGATYTTTGGTSLVVDGSVSVPTDFMGLVGFDSITVSSSSTTKWGNSRLRVALVLDNTGSMDSSGKMTALKTATSNLLSQLESAATTDGDVYVSIIPFVKDVNFDKSNYAADWIDWTDWDENNGSCSGAKGYKGSPGDQSTCEKYGGTWSPKNHASWNGCVVDRGDSSGPSTGDYDTNVVAPDTSITATLYSAEQYSWCPTAAMGLSYDWTKMNSLINSMQAAGDTNQAIGLQAGWMSLEGGGPFTAPAEDPNYTYQKVIILLTDGLNTHDRWYGYSQSSSIDARQEKTCDNIKAAGITLYTIQVDTGGDPTSTLLENCASSSDKFFLLTSADQILTTFDSIGSNLSQLRVAK